MGGGVAAAATFGSWLDPLSALGKIRWPNGELGARDAVHVNDSQFMPVAQFRRWHEELEHVGPANQRGLRAAGSPTERRYVDELRDQLERAGVSQLHFENVPLRRWTTEQWSLRLLGGQNAGPVRTASYIPYSGRTWRRG